MDDTNQSKKFLVLGAATGINFFAGILYIWSVISKNLISQLNWSSKEASLPYTVSTVFFAISMVVFGKIQDKKGPRLTATIGSILLGLGLVLSGLTTSPTVMIVTIGVITGSGVGIVNVSTAPPAVKWFPPEKKGLVTGIVVAGIGFSSIIFSPLANFLLNAVGISKTFIYLGIGILIFSFLCAQILGNPPVGSMTQVEDKSRNLHTNASSSRADSTWEEMLRSKDFYKLWTMLAFSCTAGLMIIGHISNIAKIQVDWEGGFLLVILLAIFNTIGRFFGGSISDRIGRINLMRITFILQGLNMLFFSRYLNIGLMAFGAALAGLCYGANFSIFPATILDLFGVKDFGINYGLLFTSWGLGGLIGPMTGAIIFDSTYTYNKAYLVAFVLLTIATIITFTFKKTGDKNQQKTFQNKDCKGKESLI